MVSKIRRFAYGNTAELAAGKADVQMTDMPRGNVRLLGQSVHKGQRCTVPKRWVSGTPKGMSNVLGNIGVHGQLTHALPYGKHATDANESVSS